MRYERGRRPAPREAEAEAPSGGPRADATRQGAREASTSVA